MKKITLLAAVFVCFALNAQTTIFIDDFEDQDISDWTLLDEDGDTFNFKPYDPSTQQTGDRNFMSSESWDPNVGPLFPDNYAISPAINVTDYGSLQLDYMVGGQDPLWYQENYTVYVSTGNTIADFMNTDTSVTVSFSENIGQDPNAAGELVPRNVDLSSLDNASTLYIAFRHHDSSDQFIINFDDVMLSGSLVVGIEEIAFNGFNYFISNNELNLSSNTTMESIRLFNMLGQEVLSQKLNSNNEVINLSALQSSVYIATVTIDGATKSFKIAKN